MTDNQKKELRQAFFKMLVFCTIFYGSFSAMVLTDSKEKHIFIWLVILGYLVSAVYLIHQIIQTYKK